jgi:SAM-dependent methyltransferase
MRVVEHRIGHRRRHSQSEAMTAEQIRVSERWLALREPADAAARARDLVKELVRHLPATGRQVIHDLGCGTGAMGRWLAPLLPGSQQWVLYDRDPELLEAATADLPGPAAGGAAVIVETTQSDISRLDSRDLAGATLITASALLDMLTPDEVAGLASVCVATGCPALLTLSVVGRVELTPADPLDGRVAAAFNAHQRRRTDRGRLLGPDAPAMGIGEFGRLGAQVLERPSAWKLGAAQADLAVAWFDGWVGAACDQEPELAGETDGYTRRRLAQAMAGQLAVTVDHIDLLVLPRQPPSPRISPRR